MAVESIKVTLHDAAEAPTAIVVNLVGARGPAGTTGDTGATGPQGDPGAAGAAGAAGADGSRIYYGTDAPGDDLGTDGDLFVNSATGDLWTHGGSVGWNYSLNLRGPQGATGDTGAAGAQGDQGAAGPQGDPGAAGADGSTILFGTGSPSDELGADGDLYIDTAAFDVYTHGGSTGWNYGGNLRGPQGDTGPTGLQGDPGATGPQGDPGPAGADGVDATPLEIWQDSVPVKIDANRLNFYGTQFLVTENSDGSIDIIFTAAGDPGGETIIFQTNVTAFKEPCQAATTANIDISNPGTDTFDGITLISGDDTQNSLLVKHNTAGAENGIYRFNGSGSPLTRRDDADEDDEMPAGTILLVQDGTLNGNKLFTLTNTGSIVLGTTSLSFEAIILPSNPEVLKQITAAAYTIKLTDPNKWFKMNSASAQTITVPAGNVKIPVNSVIWGQTYGAGATTFTGSNIRSSQGLTISTQYAIWRLKKIANNEWALTIFGQSSSAAWGAITGTLADQTDLQSALDAKQAADADLTTIAGLTATTDSFIQAKSSAWAARTVAEVKTDLGLTGTNSGDQTITLTGDVTGGGTGSFATTLLWSGDLLNAVYNATFLHGDLGWTKGTGWTIASDAANAYVGNIVAANSDVTGSSRALTCDAVTTCVPGDLIYAEAAVKASGTSALAMRVQILWYDKDDAFLSSSSGSLVSADTDYTMSTLTAAAPASASRFRVRVISSKTAGATWCGMVFASRKRDGSKILLDAYRLDLWQDGVAVKEDVDRIDFDSRGFIVSENSDGSVDVNLHADVIKSGETKTLTKGYIATTYDNGTVSSGVLTPDPRNSNEQKVTANGAFALSPASVPAGSAYSLVLDITNGASAGAITTSAFTKVQGDSFTTTNGHKFKCVINASDLGSVLTVVAMQ